MISDFQMILIKFGIGVFGALVVVFEMNKLGYLDAFKKKRQNKKQDKADQMYRRGLFEGIRGHDEGDPTEQQAKILRHEGYDPHGNVHIYTVNARNKIIQIGIKDDSPVQRFRENDIILYWDEKGATRATLKKAFFEGEKNGWGWP